MVKRVSRSPNNVWAIGITLFGIFAQKVPIYGQTPQPAAKDAIVEEVIADIYENIEFDRP